MKGLTIAIGICVMAAFAQGQNAPKRMRPDANRKPSGGMVEKAYGGNIFRFVDAQKGVSHDAVTNIVRKMRWTTLLPVEATSGPAQGNLTALVQAAKRLVREAKVGAGAIIIDDANLAFKIYTDEGNWAILNLAFLKEDNPDLQVLEERAEKMLWRAMARALQVGNTSNMPSVLQPFGTLAELDANKMMVPSPDSSNWLLDNAAHYGITTLTMSSYRDACHKGWAPPPKNAVQQAIWDEIRAAATNAPAATPPAK